MTLLQPWSAAFTADPYSVYAKLRRKHPLYVSEDPDAEPLIYLSRYRDIAAVLRDPRFQRSLQDETSTDTAARQGRWQHLPFYHRYVRVNLLEMEGAQHDRLRRVIALAFGPRELQALEPRIDALVAQLLGSFLAPGERAHKGEMEFIEDLAMPLPVYVISELLGWPEDQRFRLRPFSEAIVRLYEPGASAADEAAAEQATREFAHILMDVSNRRRSSPRDDLITKLVAAEMSGEISQDEVIGSAMMLLNAGHESSVNAAGNGLLALLNHPQQMSRLRAQPELMRSGVEEMLRFDAPLQFFHRYATEDLEFLGRRFRRGDKLGLLYGSANRDETVFPDAHRFLIDRQPNRHLSFGRGVHHCIGAPLARMEMAALLRGLLKELPGLTKVDARPEYHPGLVFRGLKRLKLRWDAR